MDFRFKGSTKRRDAKILRLSRLGWTEEQIAKVVELSRKRISEIIGNANFGEIDTLLSQGQDIDYIDIMKRSGWEITHIIDCTLSTQRFLPNMVKRMQKNKPLELSDAP